MNKKCTKCIHYGACRRMLEKTQSYVNFIRRYTLTKDCDHYANLNDYVSLSVYEALYESQKDNTKRIHNQRQEINRLYEALKERGDAND